MSRSKALITVVGGSLARRRWENLCAENWQRYGDRHGYDVHCLEDAHDPQDGRGWRRVGQALEHPLARGLERLVFLDATVLIHPEAGDVSAAVPPQMVGAVDAYAAPSPDRLRAARLRLYRFWEDRGLSFVRRETAEAFYRTQGRTPSFEGVTQPGVLVLSPARHRDVVLRACDSSGVEDEDGAALSHDLLSANLVHWLDARFNVSWLIQKCEACPFLFSRPHHPRASACALRALAHSYFLNFANCEQDMPLAEGWRGVASAGASPCASADTPEDSGAAAFELTTPVALILYNRAETTREVFAAIRHARPKRLLLIADGPSPGKPDDEAACASARLAAGPVDWPCEVETIYSETNLGIRQRIDTGLDWVFTRCEEAIILEDDCVPDPSFFRYCQELLVRYRDDPRIMGVGGNSFQYGLGPEDDGYYLSGYAQTWGFATWRRAWRRYDAAMARWPELRDLGWLSERFVDRTATAYWSHVFEENHRTGDHWDIAWMFSVWVHKGLFALPRHPLVSNVGLGREATHTRRYEIEFADLPTGPLRFPLRHPADIVADQTADRLTDELMFGGMLSEVFQRIRRVAGKMRPPTLAS